MPITHTPKPGAGREQRDDIEPNVSLIDFENEEQRNVDDIVNDASTNAHADELGAVVESQRARGGAAENNTDANNRDVQTAKSSANSTGTKPKTYIRRGRPPGPPHSRNTACTIRTRSCTKNVDALSDAQDADRITTEPILDETRRAVRRSLDQAAATMAVGPSEIDVDLDDTQSEAGASLDTGAYSVRRETLGVLTELHSRSKMLKRRVDIQDDRLERLEEAQKIIRESSNTNSTRLDTHQESAIQARDDIIRLSENLRESRTEMTRVAVETQYAVKLSEANDTRYAFRPPGQIFERTGKLRYRFAM
ncbi:hypothetical protein QAD02_020692 [Eretmocerus hayati]|uniref:Uncharacterized protein n=1 Tax=Eretmocerus hayati TaxID=131215 RepID=A0ACC2PNK6_9HYME|nr:hypothetical protein QAD02_020692 [Eretmocerus hayati]